MTHFDDLSPCTYFDHSPRTPSEDGRLVAIGWLESDADYRRGPVPPDVRKTLSTLLAHAWSPMMFLGGHPCTLCPSPPGFPGRLVHAMEGHPSSFRTLFLPGDGLVYAAPEAITHYIDAHGYAPPDEFCRAVADCPPMWSDAYFDALRDSGSRSFGDLVPPRLYPPSSRREPKQRVRLRIADAVKAVLFAFDLGDPLEKRIWRVRRKARKALRGQADIMAIESHFAGREIKLVLRVHERSPGGTWRVPRLDLAEPGSYDAFEVLWRPDPRPWIVTAMKTTPIRYIGLDPDNGEAMIFTERDDEIARAELAAISEYARLEGDWTLELCGPA